MNRHLTLAERLAQRAASINEVRENDRARRQEAQRQFQEAQREKDIHDMTIKAVVWYSRVLNMLLYLGNTHGVVGIPQQWSRFVPVTVGDTWDKLTPSHLKWIVDKLWTDGFNIVFKSDNNKRGTSWYSYWKKDEYLSGRYPTYIEVSERTQAPPPYEASSQNQRPSTSGLMSAADYQATLNTNTVPDLYHEMCDAKLKEYTASRQEFINKWTNDFKGTMLAAQQSRKTEAIQFNVVPGHERAKSLSFEFPLDLNEINDVIASLKASNPVYGTFKYEIASKGDNEYKYSMSYPGSATQKIKVSFTK